MILYDIWEIEIWEIGLIMLPGSIDGEATGESDEHRQLDRDWLQSQKHAVTAVG
jgi:hypothetical protein